MRKIVAISYSILAVSLAGGLFYIHSLREKLEKLEKADKSRENLQEARCKKEISSLQASQAQLRQRFTEQLILQLKNPNPEVRERAASELGDLRALPAVEPLIEILRSDTDYRPLISAAYSLGQINDPRAI